MSARRPWLGLGLAGAMLAVFAAYYLVHKPLSPTQALVYIGTLGNVTLAAFLTALGGGLGRRVLRRMLGQEQIADLGLHVVLSVALGWGILALLVLGLGLLRLLYPALLWGLAGLGLIWVLRDLLAWAIELLAAVRSLARVTGLERLTAVFVMGMLGLGALQAAAPPLKWDALVYHLTLPKLYAQTHGLVLAPGDFSFFTGMPQLAEMLYTTAAVMRLDPAAGAITGQLLGWAAGAALALGLASAARAQAWPAWLAPAILFSSFSVAVSLAWAYADLLLMLLALAMLLALTEWRRRRTLPWLAMAGVFGGLVFGCKYTGFIVPLGGLAVVLHTLLFYPAPDRPAKTRRIGPAVGTFLVAAGVVAVPWLIKNWAITGSPIYPLLFPAADVDALRLWFYNRPDLAERNVPRAALIFARAAFLGRQGGNNYDFTLGPLLVLLPAALVFGWKQAPALQRETVGQWALFVGVAYAAWVGLLFQSSLAEQMRLFAAVLPVLALMGACAWSVLRRLDTLTLRVSMLMNVALVLGLSLSALEAFNFFVNQQPLTYLAGYQSAVDYQAARLGWYPLAVERVNALPAGARVQFLWEARSLNCAAHVTCVPDVIIDRWWRLRRSSVGAADIVRQWQAAGVTHVLIYETGLSFARGEASSVFQASDWTELEALRAELRSVDAIGDAYTLYAMP